MIQSLYTNFYSFEAINVLGPSLGYLNFGKSDFTLG